MNGIYIVFINPMMPLKAVYFLNYIIMTAVFCFILILFISCKNAIKWINHSLVPDFKSAKNEVYGDNEDYSKRYR